MLLFKKNGNRNLEKTDMYGAVTLSFCKMTKNFYLPIFLFMTTPLI